MTIDTCPVKVNIDLDLTESLNALAQKTPDGFAKLTHLIAGERDVDIWSHQAKTVAQTQVDCKKILTGEAEYRDKELIILQNSDYVTHKILANEIQQKLDNYAGNLLKAAEQLKLISNEKISCEDVKPDWFARWRETAKVTSDEEMQRLWGKILAEEIKSPNLISYRTLDILKNLTSKEAEIFKKIIPTIVSGEFFIFNDSTNMHNVISFTEIMILEECGLTTTHTPVERMVHQNDRKEYAFKLQSVSIIINTKSKRPLPAIPLTSAGMELYRIAAHEQFTENHFNFIKDQIAQHDIKHDTSRIMITKIENNGPDINSVLYSWERPKTNVSDKAL